jgi:hypothetical protein
MALNAMVESKILNDTDIYIHAYNWITSSSNLRLMISKAVAELEN